LLQNRHPDRFRLEEPMRFLGMAWLGLALGTHLSAQAPEQFSLAGDRVAVFNLAGEVRIERGTASAVVVEVLRRGADADRLSIRTGELDDWRSLRVLYPSDRIVYPRMGRFSRTEFDVSAEGTFGGRAMRAALLEDGFSLPPSVRLRSRAGRVRITSGGSGLEAFADLRILVPAGRTIAVHLGVGRVDVANVEGHVRVDARSGPVNATNIGGSLLINTGSGSVSVTSARGHVHIDTGSGSVQAADVSNGTLVIDTGSGGVDAARLDLLALDIDTGSGSIRVDAAVAPELRLNTGSGSIRAHRTNARDLELDTGSGSIVLELLSDVRNARLDTGSGSITMFVPNDLGANLTVDTGSGGINVGLPLQVMQKGRTYLRGRLGDGDGTIIIDSGSGGVSLRTR
jgi:DUF4097 and DUF4098 domain-containing protein YvlB